MTSVRGYKSIHAMHHSSDDPSALMLEEDSSIIKDVYALMHIESATKPHRGLHFYVSEGFFVVVVSSRA